MSKAIIHPTAIVAPTAELDEGVEIGPFCIIGPHVKIGKRTKLSCYVRVEGRTTLGEDNFADASCYFGGAPQDLSYAGEDTSLVIGDRNKFREGFCAHRGSTKDDGITRVGSDGYFMSNTHIAHDCRVGNHVVMVQMAGLPGHVELKDHCLLGGLATIFQGGRVGRYAFLAGCCRMYRDLPPFMTGRDDSQVIGPNMVGLKRAGFTSEQIRCIKGLYKTFYNKKYTMKDSLVKIEEEWGDRAEAQEFLTFVRETKVGVQR